MADVAAFMQEVEIQQGLTISNKHDDARGIERLRRLALQLANQSVVEVSLLLHQPGSPLVMIGSTKPEDP